MATNQGSHSQWAEVGNVGQAPLEFPIINDTSLERASFGKNDYSALNKYFIHLSIFMLYHTSDFHQIGCRYAVTKLIASEIALSQYAMVQSQKTQTVPLKVLSYTLYLI